MDSSICAAISELTRRDFRYYADSEHINEVGHAQFVIQKRKYTIQEIGHTFRFCSDQSSWKNTQKRKKNSDNENQKRKCKTRSIGAQEQHPKKGEGNCGRKNCFNL